MPKKLKLDLKGLKVQSFVTSLEDGEKKQVKGGDPYTLETDCPSCLPTCNSCQVTCAESCYGTCETCASCPTCNPKVYTCANPDCGT
jgi:hypothetical protein